MDPFLAIWAALPPEWQVVAVVGVPVVGVVVAYVVKKTPTEKDDAVFAKVKGIWQRIRGNENPRSE